MFIPGETISHRFIIPFVRSDIGRVYITYHQDDRIILKKSIPGPQVRRLSDSNESYFIITFTQKESLLFRNNNDYTVQLNVVFDSGDRCTSYEISGKNGMQHIKEVVTSNG